MESISSFRAKHSDYWIWKVSLSCRYSALVETTWCIGDGTSVSPNQNSYANCCRSKW